MRASAGRHPPAEHLLEQRQHLGAHPHPGVRGVVVVRVVPDGQPRGGAGGARRRPAARRAAGATTVPPAARCSPCRPPSAGRSRGRARAAPSRPGRRGCARAATAARRARPRPRPGRRTGRCGPRPPARRRAPTARPATTSTGPSPRRAARAAVARGPLRRAGLQAVVDGDRAGPHARPRRLEGDAPRPARASRRRRCRRPATGRSVARSAPAPDGAPDLRRPPAGGPATLRRGWPAGAERPARTHALGRGELLMRRQGLGDAQTWLKPSMPTGRRPPRRTPPSAYCCILRSSPSSRRSTRSSGPAALAALGEPLAQRAHRRDDVRADAVHHVLGVPLDQAHERGQPVEDLAAARGSGSAP